MTNEEMFRRVTDAIGELATVRHTLVEMQEELQKERAESRWSEADITYAKTMKQMFSDAYWIYRSNDSSFVTLTSKSKNVIMRMYGNPFSFRQLGPGECVKLDEIIGGAE